MRRVVTVQAVYQVGDDAVVSPELPLTSPVTVTDDAAELRSVNGHVRAIRLSLQTSAQGGDRSTFEAPGVWSCQCVLRGVRAHDVSIGSEVWAHDDVVAPVLDQQQPRAPEWDGIAKKGRLVFGVISGCIVGVILGGAFGLGLYLRDMQPSWTTIFAVGGVLGAALGWRFPKVMTGLLEFLTLPLRLLG